MNLPRALLAFALLAVSGFGTSGCLSDEWHVQHQPRPPRTCANDQHCWSGMFCDRDERVCRGSAFCYTNAHCPSRYVCDFRGTCVPTRPFSSRGDGGMTIDSDGGAPSNPVADGGASQGGADGIDAASGGAPAAGGSGGQTGGAGGVSGGGGMTAPASGGAPASPAPSGDAPDGRCRWNSQCGVGGRCVGGLCQNGCTTSASCGTGEQCRAGLCQPAAGAACVWSSDCAGGGTCVNGHCHATCQHDGECPNAADMCDLNLCRPDVRPRAQCRINSECPADWSCVNGVCRTPCRSDSQCGVGCSGTTCLGGHCVLPQEVAPQCRLSSDCGNGVMCIDAICG